MVKNNTPKTCMELVRKNSSSKFAIFIPFLLLTLPLVIWSLLDIQSLEEMIVPFVICTVISICSIVSIIIAIQGLIDPAKSHLGKRVLLHSKDSGTSDIKELFEKVDKDIRENGKQYKDIIIGSEWIVGKTGLAFSNATASRLSHIKAIFYHHLIKSGGGKVRQEIAIHTVDGNYNDIVFKFKNKENMIAAYEALCAIKPDAENGSHEEWEIYMQNQ